MRKTANRDLSFLAITLLTLGLFALGLASQSANPVFLGKSLRLWIAIVVLATVSTIMVIIAWRFAAAAQMVKRVAFALALSILFLELIGFVLAPYLPIEMLLITPHWVKDVLPESAFERENFRSMRRSEVIDDPVLGRRYAPRLDLVVKQGEIRHRLITDRNGFSNVDESLYDSADIVVAGDSFTMGSTVDLEESWPQQLRKITGLRVLNLGTAAWDVYQYPRVLERYGVLASPKFIIVTLTNFNDLSRRYYEYDDYRSAHNDIRGFGDFRRRVSSKEVAPGGGDNNYLYFVMRNALNIAPFTNATLTFIKRKLWAAEAEAAQLCEFVLNGQRLQFRFSAPSLFLSMHAGEVPDLGRVAEDFARIKAIADANSSKLYYVYLAAPEEIYIPLLDSATEMNACARSLLSDSVQGRFDMNRYSAQYEKALGENADLMVNVTPYLQKFALAGEKLAWSDEAFHPNALGHKRIAEFVARYVGK